MTKSVFTGSLISLILLVILITGCQPLHEVTGTIALPENRLAFEPLHVSISVVDAATDIPLEQVVILPKGSSSIPFNIKGISPDKQYYVRYWLLSQGGKGDNFGRMYGNSVQYSFLSVGGLSVLNQAYVKEGFLKLDGAKQTTTSIYDERAVLSGQDLIKTSIPLVCVEEPGLMKATNRILSEIIQPNMTDYRKQWAIYQYCTTRIPNTISKISSYFKSEINDYDNPLTSALIEGEATWLGQPFSMHWLMANAQLETELVEIHPYQSNYPQVVVMSRYDDAYYHSNPLLASVYIDENKDKDPAIYLEKYFNYSINLYENTLSKVVFREEAQRYYGRAAQYPPIKRILQMHQLSEEDLITIECKISLPKNVYGSDQGIWGAVTLISDSGTQELSDDLNLTQEFVIKRNRRSNTFRMTVANTGAPITLKFKDTRFGLNGSVVVPMPTGGKPLTLSTEMSLQLPEGF